MNDRLDLVEGDTGVRSERGYCVWRAEYTYAYVVVTVVMLLMLLLLKAHCMLYKQEDTVP